MALKCTTKKEFEECIKRLKRVNSKAADYVCSFPPEKWARAHFKGRRFGHLTSNIAESSNSWLEEARGLCPTPLFCCFIRKVNVLFHKRRETYSSLSPHALVMSVATKLEKTIDDAWTLKTIRNAEQFLKCRELQMKKNSGLSTPSHSHARADFLKRWDIRANISVPHCCFWRETPETSSLK